MQQDKLNKCNSKVGQVQRRKGEKLQVQLLLYSLSLSLSMYSLKFQSARFVIKLKIHACKTLNLKVYHDSIKHKKKLWYISNYLNNLIGDYLQKLD